MLEPKTVEEYMSWCSLNPIESSKLNWDSYNSRHSELLGYVRWCKAIRDSLPPASINQKGEEL